MTELRAIPIDDWLKAVTAEQERLYERPNPYGAATPTDDPPVPRYPCVFCLENFDSVGKRIDHESRAHPKGLQCPVCGRWAANESGNGIHMSRAHQIRGPNYDRPGRRH